MTFANCQMGGMNMGIPDVCMTTVGPAVIPIPYPNIAQGAMADPSTAVQKVLISGAPAHTIQTIVPTSSGDESGVIGGVMSGMIMGSQKHLMGANNVLIGGMPATKMTDPTGQNGTSFNVQGSTMTPSQTKVMINSGGGSGGAGVRSATSKEAGKKEESLEITLSNLRWEHDGHSKEKSKSVHVNEKVLLKVDVHVKKGKLNPNAKVKFTIYDNSDKNNPHSELKIRPGSIKNGVGEVEWVVDDPSGSVGERELSLEFDAQLLNQQTKKKPLPVQYIKPTLILRDSVGEDAAPLMNTPWTLVDKKTTIASGKTGTTGVVSLPCNLKNGRKYILKFAGREIKLTALYTNQFQDAATVNGAQMRLGMMGYNCGNELGHLGEYTRASLMGYRDDKGLGKPSGSSLDNKLTESLQQDISKNKKN